MEFRSTDFGISGYVATGVIIAFQRKQKYFSSRANRNPTLSSTLLEIIEQQKIRLSHNISAAASALRTPAVRQVAVP